MSVSLSFLYTDLTEVRCYAGAWTSFLAEGLRVRIWEIPALKTS